MDVAIVGAGVSGLASAAFLARDGHRVVIFEKFDRVAPVGSGLLLQPTGQAVLECLGQRDFIVRAGAKITKLDGRTVSGRKVLDLDYGRLNGDMFGLGTHRSALFDALFSECEAAGVSFECGIEVSHIEGVDTAKPRLVASTGRSYGPFDLLLDAGGMFSRLRTAHLGGQGGRPFPYGAVWITADVPNEIFTQPALQQRFHGADVMIGALPIGNGGIADRSGKIAFFWSLRNDQYETWRLAPLASWKDRVVTYWPEAEPLLSKVHDHDELLHSVYADINVNPRLGPAAALIGDSAHGTSPQLGNGGNLALLDAVVLAIAFARARTVEEGLSDFIAQRRRHTHLYQMMSAYLTPVFQSDLQPLAWVRDAVFGAACRAPYFQRDIARIMAGIKTGLFSAMDPNALIARYRGRHDATQSG